MKELIRMCDCDEIQGRWEPKVGDRVLSESEQEWTDAIVTDIRTLTVGLAYLNGFHLWILTECCIYIPRIEDVLEWLGDKFRTLDYILTTMMWQTLDELGHDYLSDTPIKTLIMAYMHLEHGKSWSGEAWV